MLQVLQQAGTVVETTLSGGVLLDRQSFSAIFWLRTNGIAHGVAEVLHQSIIILRADVTMTKTDAIVRGILIGASIGVFAGLAGIMEIYRGAFLGGLVGVLAGLTMADKRSSQSRDKDSGGDT